MALNPLTPTLSPKKVERGIKVASSSEGGEGDEGGSYTGLHVHHERKVRFRVKNQKE
jgi:hypothetical protein